MEYRSFSFKNFKGIENMTIPLGGDGVTTLVGLNESGKTTILEAIFCFAYGAEDLEVINPEMASLRDPEQWIPISQRANFNKTIEITAVVELSVADKAALRRHMQSNFALDLTDVPGTIKITESHRFENSRHTKTNLSWGFTVDGLKGQQRTPRNYEGKTREWQSAVALLKTRLPRIWYFPNFLFELPERFELNETSSDSDEEERDRNRFYKATFAQVLAQLGTGANLQTHLIDRLASNERADQRSLNALLLDMGRVITTTVFGGWDRIFGRDPAGQEVELTARTDDGRAFLELSIKGPDGYYDLSERSLGFRWFFMFLMMTSFHGNSKADPKPLFLLDEPASNLHSSAQAELLKSFENLLGKCHLVYTTHSHHLINVRWLDSAFVVKNSALGDLSFTDYLTTRLGAKTQVSAIRYRQFVAKHPDQTSYFQPVLDLLAYRPSGLEPVPTVVLVEGKSDFYFLRYVTEILGLPSKLKTVPGSGASTLDPLIRLHIGWAKPFVVLLDGDAEGSKQKARYEHEFGPFLRKRCLLIPEVCGDETLKEIEDLFSSNDKERIIEAVYPDAEDRPSPKKALLQAVLELYARRESVELDVTTTAAFSRLVSSLESSLAALG